MAPLIRIWTTTRPMSEWELMLRISASSWVNCSCCVLLQENVKHFFFLSLSLGAWARIWKENVYPHVDENMLEKDDEWDRNLSLIRKIKGQHGAKTFCKREIPCEKKLLLLNNSQAVWFEVGWDRFWSEQCNSHMEIEAEREGRKRLKMKVWWDFDKQLRKFRKDVKFSICIFHLLEKLCHISHVSWSWQLAKTFQHALCAIFHTEKFKWKAN